MSRRARLWRIGGVAFVLLVGAVAFSFLRRPGDIDDYKDRYIDDTSAPRNGAVKVTFLGATTLLIEDDSTKLMTDGFLTRPGALRVALGKLRTDTALVDRVLGRVGADSVAALFVVHSHYDHALDAAYVARHTKATLYGSPSTLNVGRGGRVPPGRRKLYEPGKELPFGDFRVTVLYSSHAPQKRLISDAGLHILRPLEQPARFWEYREGGSYDLLVRHGSLTILIKPSANFVPGALDTIRADVVFLGTAMLGEQDSGFRDAYYEQTVGKVCPRLVIPIHWDDLFTPLSKPLLAPRKIADDLPAAFSPLIARTERDAIQFRILQGYRSVLLFAPGSARPTGGACAPERRAP